VREKVEEAIGPTPIPRRDRRRSRAREEGPRALATRSLQLGHSYIGTEHMLLGLVREGDGVAAQVLSDLGADMARVRTQVIQMMSGQAGKESGGQSPPVAKRATPKARAARPSSTSSVAISRSSLARANSTRSSDVRRKSSA